MTRPAAPILLVEDKHSLRTMLRLALEAQGHTVVEARDHVPPEHLDRVERGLLRLARSEEAEDELVATDVGV